MKKKTSSRRPAKRWTPEEESLLLNEIKACPQNLSKCFLSVGVQTGRSNKAVQAHWYTHTSKDPKNIIWLQISSASVLKNRKNGVGEANTPKLWNRIKLAIQSLFPSWKFV